MLVGSRNDDRRPSSRACVVSCAMMSWLSAVLIEPPLQREARRLVAGAEVTERQIAGLAAVAGVGCRESRTAGRSSATDRRGRGGRPGDVPPERAPERGVGQAADRVDHLQVEATVGRRRRRARSRAGGAGRRGRAPRRAASSGAPTTVHRKERADRARLQLLVGDVRRRHAAHAVRYRRIERVDAQRTNERRARVALVRAHRRLKTTRSLTSNSCTAGAAAWLSLLSCQPLLSALAGSGHCAMRLSLSPDPNDQPFGRAIDNAEFSAALRGHRSQSRRLHRASCAGCST